MLLNAYAPATIEPLHITPSNGPGVFLRRAVGTVAIWAARHRQRASLKLQLDCAHVLNDLGLSRTQALEEIAKPFWQE